MAYRALYREWRPKDFSHMVGQKAIMDTLRNQVINQRIAHAYLFCGSRGTGKTSTAKILARAINCLQPVNGDPCGECENCQRMDREETLDVIEIDAASNNGVDEIRDLRDTVKYPPQYGRYKIYIIDEVHMLTPSAFNALLKTLEEPPAHIVFILATTEPQKLPETILSRCQRFDFGRISIPDITGRLKEAAEGSGAHVSDGALMLIARAADGGMRDALSILDMCLGYREDVDEELVRSILGSSDSSFLFRFSDALADHDAGLVFRFIDQLMTDGKDPAVFSRDICRHIRSLLVAKASPEELTAVLDITEEEASDLLRQSERFTVSRLMKILDLYMSLETEMRYSSTPRLALENASIKCCLRLDEADQQALLDRITELETRISKMESHQGTVSGTAVSDSQYGKKQDQRPAADTVSESRTVKQTKKGGAAGDQHADSVTWNEMMNRFKRTEPVIWSFLSQGSLISSTEGCFVWRPDQAEGEKLYIAPLNKEDKRKKICDCLSEITGSACSFTAVERGNAMESADSSEETYLGKLYETFGTEPVDIVDKLT